MTENIIEGGGSEQEPPKYTIVPAVNEDGKPIQNVIRPDGTVIFPVESGMTAEQIAETFKLCDIFFYQGAAYGESRHAAAARRLFGITDPVKVEDPADAIDG